MTYQEFEILFGNIERLKAVMEKICTNEDRSKVEAVIGSYKKEFDNLTKAFESYFSVLNIADAIIVDKVWIYLLKSIQLHIYYLSNFF